MRSVWRDKSSRRGHTSATHDKLLLPQPHPSIFNIILARTRNYPPSKHISIDSKLETLFLPFLNPFHLGA